MTLVRPMITFVQIRGIIHNLRLLVGQKPFIPAVAGDETVGFTHFGLLCRFRPFGLRRLPVAQHSGIRVQPQE